MEIHTIRGNIPSQWVSSLTSQSIRSLTISGNNWRRPNKLLGYLPHLVNLYLKDNNIEVLGKDTFSGTPSLQTLYLSGNRLLHLPFGLENLQHPIGLYLHNQKGLSVLEISDSDTPSLGMLYYIYLRNMTVRVDLCNTSELVNLTTIDVTDSDLEILNGRKEDIYCTGSSLNVTRLTLHQNGLRVLPSSLLKRMINIECLDVTGNHLTDCQGNVLGKLRNLDSLDMNNNRLRKLTADCFQHLEHLTFLTLSNNEIESIEEGIFASLVNLDTLDLSRNKLVSIEAGTFASLVNLIRLGLSGNKLVSIEAGTFASLVNLVHLDLSGNKLVSIEAGTFARLRSLYSLNLSFNKVINIHYTVFLPVDMKETFQAYIIVDVNLSYNKLNEVILSTELMPNIIDLDLSNNRIRKIEVRNVRNLNFSHNGLDHIPDGLVRIPEDLESVDFGGINLACCHQNNAMLTNSTVAIYNLGTSEPFSCFLNDHKIIPHSFLLNSSLCVKHERDSITYVELWVALGLFTVLAVVFMSFVFYYRTELAYLGLFAKILKKGMRTDEQKYDDAAYDAFVCYCGKDLVWVVRHLLGSVEGTDVGYRLCIHDRDFTLGAAIDTNVLNALDRSRKVIFVLSPDFMSSKWCRWELEMATHKMFEEERHYIILIELESLKGVVLHKQLKFLMKSRPYLRWPGDGASEEKTAKFWEGLREALGQSIFCRTGRRLPMVSVLDIADRSAHQE